MPGGRWTARGGSSDGDTTERMAGRAGGMYEERKVKTVKDTLLLREKRLCKSSCEELPGQGGVVGLWGHTFKRQHCSLNPYENNFYLGQKCPCQRGGAGPAALALGLTLPCPVPSSSSTLYHSPNKARFAESY